MLKIGLTGGIGSGKSTVAKIFEVLGIPVYYADDAAKRIMNEDQNLKQEIVRAFGGETYPNGKLNRAYLSAQVFDNREKLDVLNALVHPATIRDSEEWMKQQHAPYTIREAALIFESNIQTYLDYVIGVKAPLELRISRTIARNGVSRESVMKRIENQMPEDQKISLCNFVIHNNGVEPILPQVIALHSELVRLSA